MEDRIKEVEGIVVNVINSIHKKYPFLEWDDLYQQSCVIILTLEERWVPDKAAWSSFIFSQLPGYLQWYVEKQVKHSLSYSNLPTEIKFHASEEEEEIGNPLELIPDKARRPDKQCIFMETIASMSDDAQMIIQHLLEDPEAFINCMREEGGSLTPKQIKGNIRDKLRKLGWSWPRIWNVFHEIRDTYAG